ncbi:MAG: hypothetical protein SFV54_28735 [Bryobacteraceae bacterium]|nr:hypothetical protein [Bryobacteraceae bacterium]
MARVDLYFKVEVDLDPVEEPDKLAREIARQIEKVYSVRRAEMTNYIRKDQ